MLNRKLAVFAVILGASFVVSAAVFGTFFYRSRLPVKTVKVTGVATRRVTSDIVKWRVTIVRNVGREELKSGYAGLRNDLRVFRELLREKGLDPQDLTVQPVNTNPVYGQYEKSNTVTGYQLQQSLYFVSSELAKVEELALNPSRLTDEGVVLQMANLEYFPSKLSELKRELLAEATKDAQARAKSIARSSGDRIGRIESARVGVFQITEPFSTEVSDYGIYNTGTREKDISVTVNVSFLLQ